MTPDESDRDLHRDRDDGPTVRDIAEELAGSKLGNALRLLVEVCAEVERGERSHRHHNARGYAAYKMTAEEIAAERILNALGSDENDLFDDIAQTVLERDR